jgi:hypothetical protein
MSGLSSEVKSENQSLELCSPMQLFPDDHTDNNESLDDDRCSMHADESEHTSVIAESEKVLGMAEETDAPRLLMEDDKLNKDERENDDNSSLLADADESRHDEAQSDQEPEIAEECHNIFIQKALPPKENKEIKKRVGFNDDVKVILFEEADELPRRKRASFCNDTEVKTFEVFTAMTPIEDLYDDMTVPTDDSQATASLPSYPSCGKQIHFDVESDVDVLEVDDGMVPIGDICTDVLLRPRGMTKETSPSPPKTVIQDLTHLLAELVDPNYFQQSDKIVDLKNDRGLARLPTPRDFNCAPEDSCYLNEGEVNLDEPFLAKLSYETYGHFLNDSWARVVEPEDFEAAVEAERVYHI